MRDHTMREMIKTETETLMKTLSIFYQFIAPLTPRPDRRYTLSLSPLSLLLLCLTLCIGCSTESTSTSSQLLGMPNLQFRCVDLASDKIKGLPLDQCGCVDSTLDQSEGRTLTYLDKEECLKRQDQATIMGYFGNAITNQVAVQDLLSNQKSFIDLDPTIPGASFIHIDGLMSEMGIHPYGDFLFTIQGSDGVISLIQDHNEIKSQLDVDLGVGPLAQLTIWPAQHLPLPKDGSESLAYTTTLIDDQIIEIDLDRLSLALSDVLNGSLSPDEDQQTFLDDVILRSWRLVGQDGEPISPGTLSVDPKKRWLMVAHADEPKLSVIDLNDESAPRRTIDLSRRGQCTDPYLTRLFEDELSAAQTCVDGIDNNGDGLWDADDPMCDQLEVEAINPRCPTQSQCADGLDNDEDGLIDLEDDSCQLEQAMISCAMLSEQELRECLSRATRWEIADPACDDGVDNDGDGLIDRADVGCTNERDEDEEELQERSTCLDLIDNDSDGLIDLDDEDCVLLDERDQRGAYGGEGSEGTQDDLCLDGLDNDADGLTDHEDPGCFDRYAQQHYTFERSPQCSDGVDNDLDGFIDFHQDGELGDPDCLFASDLSEASTQVEIGAHILLSTTLSLPTEERSYAYTTTSNHSLVSIDLDAPTLSARPLSINNPVDVVIRQVGALANLWVINKDQLISSIMLTSPEPLLTPTGASIYAHGTPILEVRNNAQIIIGLEVSSFYWIKEGRAFELTELSPWAGTLMYDSYTTLPILPEEVREAVAEASFDQHLPLEEQLDTSRDPQVFIGLDQYPLSQEPWNQRRHSVDQSNRISTTPSLYLNTTKINFNPERHPNFCQISPTDEGESGEMDQEGEDGEMDQEGLGACVITGDHPSGRLERRDELNLRRAGYLQKYDGISITQTNPALMTDGQFSLEFEGELPRTRSRDGYMIDRDEEMWVLVDYEQNFCTRGVEVGDLLVVERFYPYDEEAAQDERCAPYLNRTPTEGEQPLRYRISEVTSHRLTLTQDARLDYDLQVESNTSSYLAQLAIPLPPPPYECAAQAIPYYIRAGIEQWLLTHQSLGYRHPWVSRGGQCVQDDSRVSKKRFGRARLGVPFENEWFKFTLGFRSSQPQFRGVPEGQLPYMVGLKFIFNVIKGELNQYALISTPAPENLRWLPEIDRLYIIDLTFHLLGNYDFVNGNPY